MANKLREYFPMIRSREEVRKSITENPRLTEMFSTWSKKKQEEFLDMCSGVKGMKLLYDSFFKEVMNPEYAPHRLNEFLSLLLGRTVRIRMVLPNDSTRIADESSLLITDIVVELEDGSLANVEIQKIGYAFPGQRSACYAADMLLRQYRRVKGDRKNFSYREIKGVYTIVLFEKSTKEFHAFPEKYYHFFRQISDTGIELELLQKYIFVPLDIFRNNLHNVGIRSKLDAWLAFLSEDNPEMIIRLIEQWPEFREMYEDVYNLCRNIEGVMDMFSKELQELDRNTVQYMIDEQQETIGKQQETIDEQLETIGKQLETIDKQQEEIDKMRAAIDSQKLEVEKNRREMEEEKRRMEIERQNIYARISELEALLKEK